MKTSLLSAVVILHLTFAITVLVPAGARADALDNWTSAQLSTVPPPYFSYGTVLLGVAYGNGRYVAVGEYASDDNGFIESSEDGVAWTMRSPQNYSILDLYDVAFGNGTFVAVGWDYYTGRNLYHSTNGIDWVSHTNAHNSNFYAVTYGGGLFVTVGDGLLPNSSTRTNRNVYTSPDGITWTSCDSGAPIGEVQNIDDVAYGAGRFVAVDEAGFTYLSTDGTSWTRQPQLPGSHAPTGVRCYVNYCNGLFIALGNTGANFVSADGSGWSAMLKDVTNTFSRVTYARGCYAAVSGANLFTSSNGTNWVQRNLQPPSNTGWRDLAFGNSNLVVVGYTSYLNPIPPVAFVSAPFAGLAINPGFPPQLMVSGLKDHTYRIEWVEALQMFTNDWQTLATFSLTNSPLMWTDTDATNSGRIYRAALLP
jgi:hypothetical protein